MQEFEQHGSWRWRCSMIGLILGRRDDDIVSDSEAKRRVRKFMKERTLPHLSSDLGIVFFFSSVIHSIN